MTAAPLPASTAHRPLRFLWTIVSLDTLAMPGTRLTFSTLVTMSALLNLLALAPPLALATEPPGISLEIGHTPTDRPRRGAGAVTTATDTAPAGPLFAVPDPEHQPEGFRRWGHLLGDRIRTCAPLTPTQGTSRIADDLDAGRIDLWFERLTTRAVTDGGARALCIDYQIVNSPRTTLIAPLPAVTLVTDDGSPVTIAATSVSLGPLIPDISVGAAPGLPPALIDDRDPARFVARPDPDFLRRSALALAVVVIGWLAFWWWQRDQDRLRQPFAGALHALRRLRRQGRGNAAEAWQQLHDALNRSAGRTVTSAGVPALARDLPWLAPFAAQLTRFFAASDVRFFAQAKPADAIDLEALCADLRRAERGSAFEVAPRRDRGEAEAPAGTGTVAGADADSDADADAGSGAGAGVRR